VAGDGCCAKRGKLARAKKVVASAVPDFIKILRWLPSFRNRVLAVGYEVPMKNKQVICQSGICGRFGSNSALRG